MGLFLRLSLKQDETLKKKRKPNHTLQRESDGRHGRALGRKDFKKPAAWTQRPLSAALVPAALVPTALVPAALVPT